MSSDLAVSVRGLEKTYVIRRAARATTLAEAVGRRLRRPFARAPRETFAALRGIDLEVARGEALGVIGHNGAGKSTLLKILSRIVEPSAGEARIRGRVGSLLEVGTGFHRELTGRENVYLNGAILGMDRRAIDRRFDEIVAFSGVERFLDTPVKRYSSGMYVRLAFAVAAHLEPDVLIVDEVLAVGDAEFQARCLGKMDEVARGGRTVLFVSHNLAAVRSLCTRACVLDQGRLLFEGTAEEGVARYLERFRAATAEPVARFARPAGAATWMTEARLLRNGRPDARLEMGDELALEVDFDSRAPQGHALGLVLAAADGTRVLHVSTRYAHEPALAEPRRSGTVRVDFGVVPLVPGDYSLHLWFGDRTHDTHAVEGALRVEVVERDLWGIGRPYQARHSLLWWPARVRLREPTLCGS